MKDTKEQLSSFWIFALLNYLYVDVVALFAIAGSQHSFKPLPPLALMGSAVLMEIPIATIRSGFRSKPSIVRPSTVSAACPRAFQDRRRRYATPADGSWPANHTGR